MSKAALQKWAGHATPQGTSRYASGEVLGFKPAAGHFREHAVSYSGVGDREAPTSSLVLSSLGVGTYLGRPDEATDEAVSNAGARVPQPYACGHNLHVSPCYQTPLVKHSGQGCG